MIILYLEHRAINPRAESHFYISLWSAEIVSSENLRLARQPSPLDLIRCRYAELHSTCCQLLYFVKLPMSAVDHTLLSQPHQNRHCFWCTKKKTDISFRTKEKRENIKYFFDRYHFVQYRQDIENGLGILKYFLKKFKIRFWKCDLLLAQTCFVIKYHYNKLQVIHQEKENTTINIK